MEQYIMVVDSLTTFEQHYFHIDAKSDEDADRQALEIVNESDYMAKDYSLFKKLY